MSSNDDLKKLLETVRDLEEKTRRGAGSDAEKDQLDRARVKLRELEEKELDDAFAKRFAPPDNALRNTNQAQTPDVDRAMAAWFEKTDPLKRVVRTEAEQKALDDAYDRELALFKPKDGA